MRCEHNAQVQLVLGVLQVDADPLDAQHLIRQHGLLVRREHERVRELLRPAVHRAEACSRTGQVLYSRTRQVLYSTFDIGSGSPKRVYPSANMLVVYQHRIGKHQASLSVNQHRTYQQTSHAPHTMARTGLPGTITSLCFAAVSSHGGWTYTQSCKLLRGSWSYLAARFPGPVLCWSGRGPGSRSAAAPMRPGRSQ